MVPKFGVVVTAGYEPMAIIVDDDFMFVMHASAILGDAGYRPVELQNATQALTLLEAENGKIPLIFVDIEMKGMSGLELARQVNQRWPEIHIVIASGHIEPPLSEMPREATFFAKPIDIGALRSLLDQLRKTH